jgi:FAD/FMN-containing dehydrogenase
MSPQPMAFDQIPPEALARLGSRVDGALLHPGHEGFTEAIRIWNGMIRKTPALVVQPTSASDVVAAVEFARDNDVELSIKGGGHNIAGLALSDGGMTIDFSRMRAVDVEVSAGTVTVQPGCTLGDVDRVTQDQGLATTLGFVSETGVAGLTLGGGFGYLSRQFGWTVDDLLEVEIVTANGDVLRGSRDENHDLFWAIRGGGGNFGVVTEFVFRTHEIGPEVTAGLIAWPGEEAEAITSLYQRVTESAPRDMTVVMLMRNAPPAPWLSSEYHGKPMIAFLVCHTGPLDRAAADLAEIRAQGEPWADLLEVKEYAAHQSMLDATLPKGMHYYWKSEFLPGLSDEMLADYRAAVEGVEAPANQLTIFHLEGALSEFDEEDGAVGNRDAEFACVIQAMWPEGGPAEANKEWVRSTWSVLRRYSTGGNYINFQTDDEPDERTSASYRGNLARLAEVKAKYDPKNLFRVNRNITPASG